MKGCGFYVFMFFLVIIIGIASECENRDKKLKNIATSPSSPKIKSKFMLSNNLTVNQISMRHGKWFTNSSDCLKKATFTIFNGGLKSFSNVVGIFKVYGKPDSVYPKYDENGRIIGTLLYSKQISLPINLQASETADVTYELEDDICDLVYTKTKKNYTIEFEILGEFSPEQ